MTVLVPGGLSLSLSMPLMTGGQAQIDGRLVGLRRGRVAHDRRKWRREKRWRHHRSLHFLQEAKVVPILQHCAPCGKATHCQVSVCVEFVCRDFLAQRHGCAWVAPGC
jgi:hypothetical protein